MTAYATFLQHSVVVSWLFLSICPASKPANPGSSLHFYIFRTRRPSRFYSGVDVEFWSFPHAGHRSNDDDVSRCRSGQAHINAALNPKLLSLHCFCFLYIDNKMKKMVYEDFQSEEDVRNKVKTCNLFILKVFPPTMKCKTGPNQLFDFALLDLWLVFISLITAAQALPHRSEGAKPTLWRSDTNRHVINSNLEGILGNWGVLKAESEKDDKPLMPFDLSRVVDGATSSSVLFGITLRTFEHLEMSSSSALWLRVKAWLKQWFIKTF